MHFSLRRLGDKLARLEEQLLKLGLVVITCIVMTQVISRNIGHYIPWLSDAAVLAFTWMAFIGAPLAIHTGSNFIIDVWSDRFVHLKRWLNAISLIGIAVFLIFVFWQGVKWTLRMHGRVSGAGELSLVLYAISVPIGSLLSLFHLAEKTLDWIRGESKKT